VEIFIPLCCCQTAGQGPCFLFLHCVAEPDMMMRIRGHNNLMHIDQNFLQM
jgi:hypothetical protein